MYLLLVSKNQITAFKYLHMKKIVLSAAFAIIGTFAIAQQAPQMQKKDPAQMEQKRAEKLKEMKAQMQISFLHYFQ